MASAQVNPTRMELSRQKKKLMTAVRMVHEAGYEYFFIEDKIDW